MKTFFFFFHRCDPCFVLVLVWFCVWALVVFTSVLLLPVSPSLNVGHERLNIFMNTAYFLLAISAPSFLSSDWVAHSRQPQLFFLGMKSDRPEKIICPRCISRETARCQGVKYK